MSPRKSEIDKLSASYAKRVASKDTSSSALRSRAKESLQAVESAYQAAAEATDLISSLLRSDSLTAKEALQLTTSLKNITGVLIDTRAEARRTVQDLTAEQPKELDPPAPSDAALHAASLEPTQFFAPEQIGVGVLPTLAELDEKDVSDEE